MSGVVMVKTHELTIPHDTKSPYLTTSINRKAKISDMDIRITWRQQLPYHKIPYHQKTLSQLCLDL